MHIRVPARRWILLGLLMSLVVASGSAGPSDRRKVLVLFSGYAAQSTVKSIQDGLAAGLKTSEWDTWYEYLDARSLGDEGALSVWDPVLRAKYGGRAFRVVVTVGEPAYRYWLARRTSLFGGAVGVALALETPPEPRLPGVWYLENRLDEAATVRWALAQHPRAREVHVVVDHSDRGRGLRARLEATVNLGSARWDWIDEGSIDEVGARVAALSTADVLVYGGYTRLADGFQSGDRILRRVRNEAGMPIYAFHREALAPGALGGLVDDGRSLGEAAAGVAKDQAWGDPRGGVVPGPEGRWVVDWLTMRSFGFQEKDFPPQTEFVNRPAPQWLLDPAAVLGLVGLAVALGGLAVLAWLYARSQRALVNQGRAMIATQRELMQSLGNVIETRSQETAAHVQRITQLSLRLAYRAGLGRRERQNLEVAASMHDIGKVGIPDEVLKKVGRLTDAEREVMKTHTEIGYSIFRMSPNPAIQAAARIARDHHEQWDGGGYPRGIRGQEIDLLARVVTVVDVFDALLSERSYKEGWEPARVKAYLEAGSGTIFDPTLATIVVERFDEFYELWCRIDRTPD